MNCTLIKCTLLHCTPFQCTKPCNTIHCNADLPRAVRMPSVDHPPHGPHRASTGQRWPLHCTALHCTKLHCSALQCTVLHCTTFYCKELHCTTLNSASTGQRWPPYITELATRRGTSGSLYANPSMEMSAIITFSHSLSRLARFQPG